ncbi:MAG: RsmE family RNA methyltransferase [Runella sp.]
MNLFYQKNFAQTHTLTDDEAFHAAKVLRIRQGETIWVTDGQGSKFEGVLERVNPKKCDIKVLNIHHTKPLDYHIEIALAPPKNIDRLEWFVEKATEIGVSSISLFYADRSERKQVKVERLEKIAIAAMKQSLQSYLPVIQEVGIFKEWIRESTSQQKFIAHLPTDTHPPHLFEVAIKEGNYQVLIGPEGDFSEAELTLAYELGYQNVVLGRTRLRTETAALIACQVINLVNL